ncbi:MAG: ATP synthase F1 subunit epsilon [Candidatus Methylacidiphilales bacterium]
MALQLEIITPERLAYSETVDSVVLPGAEGELGILSGHVPLMTTTQPGELRVLQGGQIHHLAVGEGFIEVTGTKVTVLTDMALQESEIDEGHVEEALQRAQQALADKEAGSEEAAALMASISKSLAQLNLKRRKRV